MPEGPPGQISAVQEDPSALTVSNVRSTAYTTSSPSCPARARPRPLQLLERTQRWKRRCQRAGRQVRCADPASSPVDPAALRDLLPRKRRGLNRRRHGSKDFWIPSEAAAEHGRGAAVIRPTIYIAACRLLPLGRSHAAAPTIADRLSPPSCARYARGLPQTNWVLLAGIGHCPQLDVSAEAAQLILGFTW